MLTGEANPGSTTPASAAVVAAAHGRLLRRLPAAQHPPGADLHGRLRCDAARAAARGAARSPSPARSTRPWSPARQLVPAFFPVLLPARGAAACRSSTWCSRWCGGCGAGQSPFAAGPLHLHHRLLDLGHSHRSAVADHVPVDRGVRPSAPSRAASSRWGLAAGLARRRPGRHRPDARAPGARQGRRLVGRRREADRPASRQAVPVPPTPLRPTIPRNRTNHLEGPC